MQQIIPYLFYISSSAEFELISMDDRTCESTATLLFAENAALHNLW